LGVDVVRAGDPAADGVVAGVIGHWRVVANVLSGLIFAARAFAT